MLTASWPVMASTTSSVSAGLVAARISRTSSISAWLIERRPAVSRMTMSKPSRRPVSIARRAISTGVWPGDDRQARHAGPLGELCQLELRRRALRVEAGQQHAAAQPLLQAQRDLAGGGGLARALQPDHQDGDRRRGVEVERHRSCPAQLLDHHVVDDLHDLLAGADASPAPRCRAPARAPWRRSRAPPAGPRRRRAARGGPRAAPR